MNNAGTGVTCVTTTFRLVMGAELTGRAYKEITIVFINKGTNKNVQKVDTLSGLTPCIIKV